MQPQVRMIDTEASAEQGFRLLGQCDRGSRLATQRGDIQAAKEMTVFSGRIKRALAANTVKPIPTEGEI